MARVDLPQDQCACDTPKVVEGSVLCGNCRGNLYRAPAGKVCGAANACNACTRPKNHVGKHVCHYKKESW